MPRVVRQGGIVKGMRKILVVLVTMRWVKVEDVGEIEFLIDEGRGTWRMKNQNVGRQVYPSGFSIRTP